MGKVKKLRDLINFLKDKASLIKATLLSSPKLTTTSSSINAAVLRSTTHDPTSPPPPHRIAAVLSLGNSSRAIASRCIGALVDRLHRHRRSAAVALKCLIAVHHVINRGSFILRDQLSFYPSAGCRNFLNLSAFREGADLESWELSMWVRWYGGVLERNLIVSRVLGFYFSSSSQKSDEDDSVTSSFNSDLLREIEALVGMVDGISNMPFDFLNFHNNKLVCEVIRLVGEDYESTQYQISIRLSEFEERMGGVSCDDSAELMGCLRRIEDCKVRLEGLFVNSRRNCEFWDQISEIKKKVEGEERERGRLVMRMRERNGEGSELTRFVGPSQLLQFHPSVSTAVA